MRRLLRAVERRAVPVAVRFLPRPFAAAMRVPRLRRVLSRPRPRDTMVGEVLFHLHNGWWASRPYSPDGYREYVRDYWNSFGQWRWQNSQQIDLTEIHDTLARHAGRARSLFDIGCGRGDLLAHVGEAFPHLSELAGIDASEQMIAVARQRAPDAEIVTGFFADEALPTRARFDVVVARSSLTLVPEDDIGRVLAWAAGLAEQLLVISEPSGELEAESEQVAPGVWRRLHDRTHVRDYGRYEALRDFELVEEFRESRPVGNRQWVFVRRSTR